MHERPFDSVQDMLAVANSAQALCDSAEITYEELFEMPETCLVVVTVPAIFGNLYADFFGIAFEAAYGSEISAVQLPPFRTERSKDPTGSSNEMLMRGSH